MSDFDSLIIILLFGIFLIPFLEVIFIFCIIGTILTFSVLWIPLCCMMFPMVYVKERGPLNQLWTGKGPYKIRSRQFNPLTGKYEKIKIY